MALTKSSTVVANDTVLTAGAGDVTTVQSLVAAYQATARIRLTNGATGPTLAARVLVQIAESTTVGHFMTLAIVTGTITNAGVVEQVVTIPDTTQQVRFVRGANTGQNVTERIVLDTITGY